MRGGRVLFSLLFVLFFLPLFFLFICCCGVGGDSFSACGPRCFCQQLAGGPAGFALVCRKARCALHCALSRRCARVLHLCFRPACLASFRFCEGFHACRLFARPVCCLRGFSLLSFAFSCLTFASQKSFHLSLMPRRAPHFLFGKKMGEKNREGRCPFEPHSSALWPISPFPPRCWPAYAALRPQTAG